MLSLVVCRQALVAVSLKRNGSIPRSHRSLITFWGRDCALLLANAINVLLNCARIFWRCVQSAVPSSLVLDNTLNNPRPVFLMAFKVDKKLIGLPHSRLRMEC